MDWIEQARARLRREPDTYVDLDGREVETAPDYERDALELDELSTLADLRRFYGDA